MKDGFPKWLETAVFYQVYPQSFFDTNGDGIGDIPGIIRKLDYIKSLGCDAVWVNPCFVSPFGDAGYDVADFCKVAPRYGTNADLCRLFREAERRRMRVVLDLVAGHTSIEHPWFAESCRAKKNRYTNRYIWTGSVWEHTEPGLRLINGHAERDGNFAANFFYFQPALNYGFGKPDPGKPWQLPTDHPDVKALKREMVNIMRFWLDRGASGFRVDMAGSLVKGDPGRRGTSAFWKEVRAKLDRDYPDAVLISEWSVPKDAIGAGFHVDFMLHFGTPAYTALFRKEPARQRYHAPPGHSFFDAAGKGDIREFLDIYVDHYRKTKRRGCISLPSGNHDMPRLSLGRTRKELEVAFAFLLTMPGVPFLYYGDEIGMRFVKGLVSKEGAFNRTGARTPMQWNAKKNAGFSSAPPKKLYLPLDPSPKRPTVEAQEADPRSMLNTVRRLIALRKETPALAAEGAFTPLFAKSKQYPFVYLRARGGKKYLVALNPSKKRVRAEFRVPGAARIEGSIMGRGVSLRRVKKGRLGVSMEGVSYGIFKL